MSLTVHLKKEKIERLIHFLKNGSAEESCKRFDVNSSAFRQSISNTVKTLETFYVRGEEHFIGDVDSTIDVSFNKELVMKWVKRHTKKEKPNSIASKSIEPNEDEIMRAIIGAYPPKNQMQSYGENSLRIEGALWVLRNYKVTNKIKTNK